MRRIIVPIVGIRFYEKKYRMSVEALMDRIRLGDEIEIKQEADGQYIMALSAYWINDHMESLMIGHVEDYTGIFMNWLFHQRGRIVGNVTEKFNTSLRIEVVYNDGDFDGLEEFLEKKPLPEFVINRHLIIKPPYWETAFQLLYDRIESKTMELERMFLQKPEWKHNEEKQMLLDCLVEHMRQYKVCDNKSLCVQDSIHLVIIKHLLTRWSKIDEITNLYGDTYKLLLDLLKDIQEVRNGNYKAKRYEAIYNSMFEYTDKMAHDENGMIERFFNSQYIDGYNENDLKELRRKLINWLDEASGMNYSTIAMSGKVWEWSKVLQYAKFTRNKIYQLLSHEVLLKEVEKRLECNTVCEVPKELQGEKNESILKKFVEKGLLTDDYQPSNDLSRTQKAVLADRLAELLEIKNKWKFFESFWGMSYLSSAFIRGLDQKDMDKFLKKVSIIE